MSLTKLYQPNQFNLDERLLLSGLLGIPGINQSRDRKTLGDYDIYYIENLEPDPFGWNNNKIGVVKRNTSTPVNAKVQGIFSYEDKILFVANGNLYEMDDSAFTVSLASGGAGIFDTTARVRGIKNQGKTGSTAIKLYMCDGVSATPRRYNGSTVASFSLGTYGVPQTVSLWRSRTVWTFEKTDADRNKILFSQEEDGDDYNTAGSSALDAFDDECFPGDGDYIVGLGTVQYKGSDTQLDALVVCKSKQSFMATDITLDSGVRTTTFNNNGVDIGAVSPDAMIQFGNDLWVLTKTGIKGFNSTLQGSGGVSSFADSPSNRIDRLIKRAAENTAFENAFAIHHADKQKVRFFMPKDSSVSTSQDGFTYPEIPCNYALNYAYGLLPKIESNPRGEAFYARGGTGFAFSCACVHKGRLFLGDYFGNIYELESDESDDNIPYSGETDQPITSIYETPFMMFGQPYQTKKRIVEWLIHGRSIGQVQYNTDITIIEDRSPYSRDLNTITSTTESTTSGSVWGASTWGGTIWTGDIEESFHQVQIRPPGWGNAFGIKHWFMSKRIVDGAYQPNNIWMYAFSGTIEKGKDR